jgi:DnaD/phage-associated family protein
LFAKSALFQNLRHFFFFHLQFACAIIQKHKTYEVEIMVDIHLHSNCSNADTMIPNSFIDDYMPSANGEFVKVYLYLLRCMNSHTYVCSISAIADTLNHTEMDVIRALRYWQKVGLLSLEENADGQICGIHLLSTGSAAAGPADAAGQATSVVSISRTIATPAAAAVTPFAPAVPIASATAPATYTAPSADTPATYAAASADTPTAYAAPSADAPAAYAAVSADTLAAYTAAPTPVASITAPLAPAKRRYTADEILAFRRNEEISELVFIVETYIKRTLSENDMNTVLYWHEQLHFSTELIVYLLEYCISKGHTSMRYMDKVALGWHEKGIDSVEQAKEDAAIHSQTYYGVMKALGITGRSLVDTEKTFIHKWTKEYKFDLPLIQEACGRTITATHQPSFEYTDSILTSWHKNHVHTIADVQKLDAAYTKAKKTASRPAPAARKNSFTNFSSREYDYDNLEEILLSSSAN